MIEELDVSVNQHIGFAEIVRFMSVNAFDFEDGEEVFCHCVIIRIASS